MVIVCDIFLTPLYSHLAFLASFSLGLGWIRVLSQRAPNKYLCNAEFVF